ncbi:sodium:calcium antiporter [Candidatus Woesearchaeota archaeon]|jgi:cation:H+ antiporter|nr:sodium:calcium antiporter [Candidatus Woesearchaeota archaeon]
MIIINLILFLIFLAVSIKAADYSIKHASKIAKSLKFPEFIVSFFVIAIISCLPEAIISIISAFNHIPELGLGTLLGSNVADLTLVFGIVALTSFNGIKVKSKILRNNLFYLILLVFPLLLGLDGKFSRLDGLILIILGLIFFYRTYEESKKFHKKFKDGKREPILKSFILLVLGVGILIFCSQLTVNYAKNLVIETKIPEILVGITLIAFGTCLPELIFSIKAVKSNHDELALGDILGTVITDATIILGLVALISPFSYNINNIYILGGGMFLAGICVITFMNSDKTISKIEGLLLILLYVFFIILESLITNVL